MSRGVSCAGVLLAAGVAVLGCAGSTRADDGGCCAPCGTAACGTPCCSPFAYFRRCGPEGGVVPNLWTQAKNLCRPPRCPPYCDPTFGYYPTAWRSWPSLYVAAADELMPPAGDSKGSQAAPTGPGGAPATMPPASDEARRRLPNVLTTPTARTPAAVPILSGASER